MRRSSPRRRTLSAVILAALAPAASVAQQPPARGGAVRGVVYDSTSHAPLSGAAVFLWNTSHRTTASEDGTFLLSGVPAGRYDVLFYHERLGTLGFSAGPTAVEVPGGDTVDVFLSTPSMSTLARMACLLEEEGTAGTGILTGWVGDAESGLGMPGARVSLSWTRGEAKTPERMLLRTDAGGFFSTCGAPADVPISASAYFLDRQGPRREIRIDEGGVAEERFLLGVLRPVTVSGHLMDAATGHAVTEAEVWLRGTSFRGLTGPDGHFRFEGVPPGDYMLMTDHLAYGTKMDTLSVPSGRNIRVEMRLDTRPIEIAPLTVTVESQPLTQRSMGGITVTRAEIVKVRDRVRDVADILRSQHMPGVIVERRGADVCIGYMPGQIRMSNRNGCVPMIVFIDGVRATNTNLAVQIPPDAIERITIYKPVEAGNLFGLGAGNGVLAIYTRGH